VGFLRLSITKRQIATADATADTLTVPTATNLAVGDPFTLTSSGSLPTGLTASLFVGTGSTATVIKPADSTGSLIDFTDTGSGTLRLEQTYTVVITRFNGLNGYARTEAVFTTSEKSAYGLPAIRKRLYSAYVWTINCYLPWRDLQTLEAMLRVADANWDQPTEDGSLILEDWVETVADMGPRTRGLATGSTEQIGQGIRTYNARFKVQLTDLQQERFQDTFVPDDPTRLHQVSFVLNELDRVT